MNERELIACFLPEGILDYFEIIKVENIDVMNIYLEEKNSIPNDFPSGQYQSKGFYEEIEIQDFPIRRKACYLRVKRRRWTNLETGETHSRDWNLVAKGTRMTEELALFLKGLIR